jgi:hypothetical protein
MARRLWIYVASAAMVLLMVPAGAGAANAGATSPAQCTSWAHKKSPNAGTGDNDLYGVAAVSPSNAWAVGEYFVGVNTDALIEHWNGKTWRVVPSPDKGTGDQLKAVYAVSATNVWAAGSYYGTMAGRTLIEHWNGKAWSVVPSPNLGSGSNEILSIRGTSASDIWAVGNAVTSYPVTRTVILHWNGKRWRLASSPSEPSVLNVLTAVRPLSAANAWAVGYVSGAATKTLILHWSHGHWRIVPSPNTGTQSSTLSGVRTTSAADAWAVGDFSNGTSYRTFIVHWNGRHWRTVSSPDAGKGNNDLNAIGGASATSIYAAGTAMTSDSMATTLILHWNGKRWRTMPSPSPGTVGSYFTAIYAQSPTAIWAVGSFNSGHFNRTLIEYCG